LDELRIINGNEKGCLMGNFSSIEKPVLDLLPNEYFLNNATGELFRYQKPDERWAFVENTYFYHED